MFSGIWFIIKFVWWVFPCIFGFLPSFGGFFCRYWTPWKRYDKLLFGDEDGMEPPQLIELSVRGNINSKRLRRAAKIIYKILKHSHNKYTRHLPESFSQSYLPLDRFSQTVFSCEGVTIEDIEALLHNSNWMSVVGYLDKAVDITSNDKYKDVSIGGGEGYSRIFIIYRRALSMRLKFKLWYQNKYKSDPPLCGSRCIGKEYDHETDEA